MRHGFAERCAFPGDYVRPKMTKKYIAEKDTGDNHQRRPQGASCGFKYQHYTDTGNHQVHGGGQTGSLAEIYRKNRQVHGDHDTGGSQYPVLYRNPVAR